MSRRLAALSVLVFSLCLIAYSGTATGDEPKAKATSKSTSRSTAKTTKRTTTPAPTSEKSDK
jgi:hypothetical protein